MAVRKTKQAALEVPQSDEEADALLAEYGATFNTLARQQVRLDELLAKLKARAETKAKPLQESLSSIMVALNAYGAANRKRLTNGGETKTVKLPSGEIGWRTNPPSVKVKRGLKAEDLIASIRQLKLRKFLRLSVEVNKRAMLDDPEKAETIPGITIQKDVEEFFVAPFGAELAEPKT